MLTIMSLRIILTITIPKMLRLMIYLKTVTLKRSLLLTLKFMTRVLRNIMPPKLMCLEKMQWSRPSSLRSFLLLKTLMNRQLRKLFSRMTILKKMMRFLMMCLLTEKSLRMKLEVQQ